MEAAILNTRPAKQAELLTQACQTRHWPVIELPALEISAYPFKKDLPTDVDFIIYTSANAVEHAGKIKQIKGHVIAIGAGTANKLNSENRMVNSIPSEFCSQGILALPELKSVKDKNIIIVTGKNPKTLLEATLKKRGADVILAEVYQRQHCDYSENTINNVITQPLQAIIVTSIESLQNLQRIFQQHLPWFYQQTFIATSPAVAAALKQQSPDTETLICDNTSTRAIINKLEESYHG